jgi:putative hydrolase of the HAD superfamily
VLKRLRDSYKIYLFSNTNAIHIGRLLPDFKREHGFDFPALFDKTFYSHEIQARKPDIEAYQKVIRLSGVEPGKTLFVDDLEQNIRAAQEVGLKTFWLSEGLEMAELF